MRVTWWGHATCTVAIGGLRVLTDPVLTDRVAHLTRIGPAVRAAAALDVDLVVISHLHSDHLHLPSLRRLGPDVRVVAPSGTAGVLRRTLPALAARMDEVGPGERLSVSGVEIRAVTAAHDGRRLPGSRHRGPALGYVLDDGTQRAWFAGDTGLYAAMSDIGPVDVALVPVGGWGPTLGPEHLDPRQAAEAVRRVGARDAVPIHFGTLWPIGLRAAAPALFAQKCLAPGRVFAAALDEDGSAARAHVLAPGDSVVIA
jgi:L-ascorbate metabolism protein UlaG (beta-lactamase superfamily)